MAFEGREIHVGGEILFAGRAKEIFAGAVFFVGQQGAAHVAMIVEFLCFVAVVNGQRETAAEPCANFVIHAQASRFTSASCPSCSVIPCSVRYSASAGVESATELFAQAVRAQPDVNFAQLVAFADEAMDRQRVEKFI